MSYDYYTSDLRRHTITTDRTTDVSWGRFPETGRLYGSPEGWEFRPYRPYAPTIPVIRRKPKSDPWEKYTDGMRDIEEVKDVTAVTKAIEIRPVLVCGWCGARIPRGKEEDPCEYCGS